jgi:hypothetical protein
MAGFIASFNPKLYRQIAEQSFLKSLGFLMLLALFTAAVFSFRFSLSLNRQIPNIKSWAKENLAKIASELPEIEVQNGTLSLPKEKFIKEWGKAEFALIIDPDAENTGAIFEKYRGAVVVTKNRLVTKVERDAGSAEIKTYSLEKMKLLKVTSLPGGVRVAIDKKDFQITVASVNKLLEIVRVSVFPVLVFLLFFWFCFTKLCQVLFFSLFSLVVNASLKAGLTYRQLLNIGIYALVVPTALAAINFFLNERIPFFGLIYILGYLAYLFVAVKASIATEEKRG